MDQDSIALSLDVWMRELPGTDPAVESARQRISGLGRLLERGLERIAEGHGFTLGDWDALSALQRSGPPYERLPKELAGAMGITSGTVTVRIDRLAAAGLVERLGARADGRSRPVKLTAKGQERWRVATAERTAMEDSLTRAALDPGDLAALNTLLSKLLTSFEADLGAAPVRGPATP